MARRKILLPIILGLLLSTVVFCQQGKSLTLGLDTQRDTMRMRKKVMTIESDFIFHLPYFSYAKQLENQKLVWGAGVELGLTYFLPFFTYGIPVSWNYIMISPKEVERKYRYGIYNFTHFDFFLRYNYNKHIQTEYGLRYGLIGYTRTDAFDGFDIEYSAIGGIYGGIFGGSAKFKIGTRIIAGRMHLGKDNGFVIYWTPLVLRYCMYF